MNSQRYLATNRCTSRTGSVGIHASVGVAMTGLAVSLPFAIRNATFGGERGGMKVSTK